MSARMEKVQEAHRRVVDWADSPTSVYCRTAALAAMTAALAEVEEWEARLADAHRAAARVEVERDRLAKALRFYADPETYLAIGFFPDPPCGEFMDDFDDQGPQFGFKPGKRARAALAGGKVTGSPGLEDASGMAGMYQINKGDGGTE